MSIDQDGFLSGDIAEWIAKHRAQHKAWFNLVDQVNQLGQRAMLLSEPKVNDKQQMLCAVLLARCVSAFQGAALLAERGMIVEARYVARGLVEATFSIRATANDIQFVNDYVADDKHRLLAMYKGQDRMPDEMKKAHGTSAGSIHREITKLKAVIAQEKPARLTTASIAERAHMQLHYDTVYALLSGTAHVRVRDLGNHVDDSALGGDNPRLFWGPDARGIDFVLTTITDLLFIAIRSADDVFSLRDRDTTLGDRLLALWNGYQTMLEGVNFDC